MQKKKIYLGIRGKLLLSLLLISLFMIVYASVTAFYFSKEKIEDVCIKLSNQNAHTAGKALNDYVNTLGKQSNNLLYADELVKIALEDSIDQINDEPLKRIINSQTRNLQHIPFFSYIGIYLKNGYCYSTKVPYEMPFMNYENCLDYFEEGAHFANDGEYIPSFWSVCRINNKRDSILVYVRFVYEPLTFKKLGIMVLGVDPYSINSIYREFAKNGFIVSLNGIVFSSLGQYSVGDMHPNAESIQKALKRYNGGTNLSYQGASGKKEIVSCCAINAMNAYLIAPFDFYNGISEEEMGEYKASLVLMGVIGILIAIMLAVYISAGISKSFASLVKFTRQVGHGNESLRFSVQKNDEISMLGGKINSMLDQIEKSNQKIQEELQVNQEIELKMYQQQINPHLLYNSLDSVLWVLQKKDFESASELVCALSSFFKISLSKGSFMIPIKEEIRLVECYVNIQKLARHHYVNVLVDIDEELMEHNIMKLTIQPLVENAIIHGFAGYREDGSILIAARIQENRLQIKVEDNGIGMTEEELQKIQEALQLRERPKEFLHFGLYNINRRIIQKYGDDYGLTINSEVSEFTRIIMNLPYGDVKKEQGNG